MQGFDMDDSDAEWEQDIREEFGTRGIGVAQDGDRVLDMGMDTVALVQHTFHVYDGLVANIGVDDGHGGNEESPDYGNEAGPGYAMKHQATHKKHAMSREKYLLRTKCLVSSPWQMTTSRPWRQR